MTQNVAPDLGWAPSACTLPTTEQPLRVAEFDALFTDAVQTVARPAPTRLRLELVFSPMDGLVVLFPAHVTRYWHGRTSPTCQSLIWSRCRYALVWRRESESEPIRALAGIVRDLGPLPSPLPALDVVRHPRVGSDAKRAGCYLAVRQFALSRWAGEWRRRSRRS